MSILDGLGNNVSRKPEDLACADWLACSRNSGYPASAFTFSECSFSLKFSLLIFDFMNLDDIL